MIETEFKRIRVETSDSLIDDEVRLSIEDTDPYGFGDAKLNLCWLKKKELTKLIGYLQEAKGRLEEKERRLQKIIESTDFSHLYLEFDRKYNPYPIDMARYEAFGKAYSDGLIDKETLQAAEKYYGKLWNYVGD